MRRRNKVWIIPAHGDRRPALPWCAQALQMNAAPNKVHGRSSAPVCVRLIYVWCMRVCTCVFKLEFGAARHGTKKAF